MIHRTLRLGDSVDDYCSPCRFVSNHVVVSLLDGQPKKVRCQTCQSEHDYRHGKGGRPKKTEVQSLVQKLLDAMPEPPTPPLPKPPKPSFKNRFSTKK